jgi:hypothetical protein
MPGHNGGANFGTSAVDPDRGEFYVVHKSLPTCFASRCLHHLAGRVLSWRLVEVAAVVAVVMRSSRRKRRRS